MSKWRRSFYEELPCEINGECEPIDADSTVSNCTFCGSEMHKLPYHGWLNWSHPAVDAFRFGDGQLSGANRSCEDLLP